VLKSQSSVAVGMKGASQVVEARNKVAWFIIWFHLTQHIIDIEVYKLLMNIEQYSHVMDISSTVSSLIQIIITI
jgi:hypothetical protein